MVLGARGGLRIFGKSRPLKLRVNKGSADFALRYSCRRGSAKVVRVRPLYYNGIEKSEKWERSGA